MTGAKKKKNTNHVSLMHEQQVHSPQNQIIPIVISRGNHPKAPVLECPQCDQLIIIITNTGAVLTRINSTVPFRKDYCGRRASIRPPASVSVIVCHLVWQPTSTCASASTVRACGTVLAALSPNTNRSPASADIVEAQAPQVYHIR